jgi:phenylalanyl-tRNA synthetase beta chain
MLPQTEQARPLARVRQILADCGYQEVVNFAFVEEAWEADFAGNAQLIRLANPIASHLSVMRSSLIGGLVGQRGDQPQAQAESRARVRNRALLLPRSAGWPGRRFSPAVETHGAGLRYGVA